MTDWEAYFVPAAIAFLAGHNPYAVIGFGSPPWSLLAIAPLAWIPPIPAMLLPALALILLAYHRRKPHLLFIVGVSFPFFVLTIYANIDWMVMIGVAIGGRLGVILNTVKPQAGVFAILAEIAKRPTWRARIMLLLPLAVLAAVSLPLLPAWLHNMFEVSRVAQFRSLSLFPYTIPPGLVALWYTWRRKDPLLGVVASLCLSPYFYFTSLIPALYLIADRNWRWGVAANVATWILTALIMTGVIRVAW